MLEPTARLKDYINGSDVVTELKPGQTLRHHPGVDAHRQPGERSIVPYIGHCHQYRTPFANRRRHPDAGDGTSNPGQNDLGCGNGSGSA